MKGAEGSLVEDLIESMGLDGRRVYSAAGKRALVERALEPGVSVSRLALDHGVNANLLRKWIRAYQGSGIRSARRGVSLPGLLPVVTSVAADGSSPSLPSSVPASMEIVVAGVSVHVHGAVDALALGTVLDCLLARR